MKKRFASGIVFALFFLLSVTLQALAQSSASQPSSSKPLYTFAVVSDLHASENDGPGYFKAFVKQIDALPDKPEFVLVTGDIHVAAFKKVFDEIKPAIPFHVVSGNHENKEAREVLAKMFPADLKDKDFYSFPYKNSFFIGLSTAAATGDHVGHFESEFIRGERQGQWLEEQLAQNYKTADHIFIFAHIGPNPAGNIGGGSYLTTNDQKQLRELTAKYNPTAMFFGHWHSKTEFKIAETPVYVLPSLNWNFNQQPRQFMVVKVFKDKIDARFVDLQYTAPVKK
jgi:predicted phosphodiesterase